jgi:hypothetical protein
VVDLNMSGDTPKALPDREPEAFKAPSVREYFQAVWRVALGVIAGPIVSLVVTVVGFTVPGWQWLGWMFAAVTVLAFVCAPYWVWKQERQRAINTRGEEIDRRPHFELKVLQGGLYSSNVGHLVWLGRVSVLNTGAPSCAYHWEVRVSQGGAVYLGKVRDVTEPVKLRESAFAARWLAIRDRAKDVGDWAETLDGITLDEWIVPKTEPAIGRNCIEKGWIQVVFTDVNADGIKSDALVSVTCKDCLGREWAASSPVIVG